jgi:hypothetical protein
MVQALAVPDAELEGEPPSAPPPRQRASDVYRIDIEPLRGARLRVWLAGLFMIAGGGNGYGVAAEAAVIRRLRDGAEVGRHRLEAPVTLDVILEHLDEKSPAEFGRMWCTDETP